MKDFTIKNSVLKCYNSFDKEVIVPNNVTVIGERAFVKNCVYCTESVTLPNSIIRIEDSAFDQHPTLKYINFPDGLKYIGRYAFYGCGNITEFKLPDSIEEIMDSAFGSCDSITYFKVPENVIRISPLMFTGCDLLKEVILSDATLSIGRYAFQMCSSLKHIKLPSKINYIEEKVFNECTSLEEIIIPDSVIEIGEAVFNGCSALKYVTLSNSMDEVPSCTFADCTSLKEINIPSSVKTIEWRAFYNCTSLEKIIIPSSVKIIETRAFENCTSLTKIVIPDSVTELYNAFEGCTNLKSVTLPDSLKQLSPDIFAGCPNIIDIKASSKIISHIWDSLKPNVKEAISMACLRNDDVPQKVADYIKRKDLEIIQKIDIDGDKDAMKVFLSLWKGNIIKRVDKYLDAFTLSSTMIRFLKEYKSELMLLDLKNKSSGKK